MKSPLSSTHIRNSLTLLLIPMHCLFRYVFLIYTQDAFQLLMIKCLLLGMAFWLGKSQSSISKLLCYAYIGILPTLIANFIPENLILGACSNFIMIMLVSVFEDTLVPFFVLTISNTLAWSTVFASRWNLETNDFPQTEVN